MFAIQCLVVERLGLIVYLNDPSSGRKQTSPNRFKPTSPNRMTDDDITPVAETIPNMEERMADVGEVMNFYVGINLQSELETSVSGLRRSKRLRRQLERNVEMEVYWHNRELGEQKMKE